MAAAWLGEVVRVPGDLLVDVRAAGLVEFVLGGHGESGAEEAADGEEGTKLHGGGGVRSGLLLGWTPVFGSWCDVVGVRACVCACACFFWVMLMLSVVVLGIQFGRYWEFVRC